MKYFVNESCIGCGLCNSICPNVFEMTNEDVAKAVNTEISESDINDAHQAMEDCPVNAIEEE